MNATHRALSALLWCFAAMLALTACTTPATEVVVTVDTDARFRVETMRALVSLGNMPSAHPNEHRWARTGTAQALAFPGSFAVHPGDAPDDSFVTLQVELIFAPRIVGEPAVTLRRTARFRFTPHTASAIRLFFPLTCAADVAPPARCATTTTPCTVSRYCEEQIPAQTCGDNGQCTAVDITPLPVDVDAGTVMDARTSADVATTDVRDVPAIHDAPDACVCPSGTMCNAAGACVCSPVCGGRRCGGDSCGGSCGTCGAGTVCNMADGTCFACSAGAPCDTGNPCTTGAVACTSGIPSCMFAGAILAGTNCPGGTCDGSGNCVCTRVTCAALTLCDPSAANMGQTSAQADGCGGFVSCGPCCSSGTFCGGGQVVDWRCNCGSPPDMRAGWADQGTNCWHRVQDGPVSC